MKALITTTIILSAIYSSEAQGSDLEKNQKSLIDSIESVTEMAKRAVPVVREEFHLVEDRF
jgi:hypothetical protein